MIIEQMMSVINKNTMPVDVAEKYLNIYIRRIRLEKPHNKIVD